MRRAKYAGKLMGDIVKFAHEHGVYWLVPLVFGLLIAGSLIAVGQIAAPLLYTLF